MVPVNIKGIQNYIEFIKLPQLYIMCIYMICSSLEAFQINIMLVTARNSFIVQNGHMNQKNDNIDTMTRYSKKSIKYEYNHNIKSFF